MKPRINITLDEVEQMERDLTIIRHIERYGLIRQFLYGNVLDVACGVGYGTYMIAKNPDVKKVIGIDNDSQAIEHANFYFKGDKTEFIWSPIEIVSISADILVSLETIEHLEKPEELAKLADRCGINEIILSYPAKKTTHYHPFHIHDFTKQDLEDLFPNYSVIREFNQADTSIILHLIRHKKFDNRKRYKKGG